MTLQGLEKEDLGQFVPSGVNALLHHEVSSQLSRNLLGAQKHLIFWSFYVQVLYCAVNSNSYESRQTKQQANPL